jgi:transposase InsO family protein
VLVDGAGEHCGKPWITFEIDNFSRMVVGFHISLGSPTRR